MYPTPAASNPTHDRVPLLGYIKHTVALSRAKRRSDTYDDKPGALIGDRNPGSLRY
jgi:hypothetical protein